MKTTLLQVWFWSVLCAIGGLPSLGRAADGPTRPPNIIILFCDNLGYGDIGPFGSTLHRTPALDRMAREGRRFTHFYASAGVCTPSRASLLTGCYSQRVGLHTTPRDGIVLRPLSPFGLAPEEVTIAEVLKSRGYRTAIIGKWHLGDQPEFLPTRQGFDYFLGVPYSDDMTRDVGKRLGDRYDGIRWPPLPLMKNDRVIEAPVDRNGLTRRYTEAAVRFIRDHRHEPFFLYLPHAMPGSTRAPFAGERFRGKSRNGPWGDSVEELDWSTGVLLDELVRLGIADHTLVLFTSDNGAPLARDPGDPSRGSNRPLGGRGYTTSEGGFRVPAIFWWPGKIPAGTTCEELATTMDLLPTCVALAGASPPRDRIIDGHDIRPLLFGEPNARTPYPVFYYYDADQLQAVRSGRWKLYLPLTTFRQHPHFRRGKPAEPLLFDVVADPGEQRNLADRHADVVSRLMNMAEAARGALGDRGRPGREQRRRGHVDQVTPRVLSACNKTRRAAFRVRACCLRPGVL